jgi:calcineurin-like phosphoesterase family protein
MTTFFYSDPHYGHYNIIKYCNRPYSSAEEMDNDLVKRYNSRVSKNDTVIWLGDCGFYRDKVKAKALMDRLNGKKILIRGNHDNKPGWMAAIGFEFVAENATIMIGKKRVRLSHFPYKVPFWTLLWLRLRGIKIRFNQRRLKDDGSFLIHGHVHKSWPRQTGKMINVSCDVWDYKPVPMKEIVRIIDKTIK